MERNIGSYSISSRQRGFALAEVMVAIFFITLAIILVGALSTQVANLSKSSKQTSAVIELRNKTNSFTKDPVPWLGRMRSNSDFGNIFSACIPDATAAAAGYKCPAVNDALLSDSGLKDIAGEDPVTHLPKLHPYSTPIVDAIGEKIAGTVDAPLYLDSEGRACKLANPATSCPMMSVGYFLRGTTALTGNPGGVVFVVKIYQNQDAVKQRQGTNVMRPQYLTMNVGTDWNKTGEDCTYPLVKFGYNLDTGAPLCVDPHQHCDTGLVATGGSDSSGKIICKALPTCKTGESAVVDVVSGDLKCSNTSPCGAKELFMGYAAGSGDPLCNSPDVSCDDGYVQTGVKTNSDGKLEAKCMRLPSCLASEKLSYDGSIFECKAAAIVSGCDPATEDVTGIDSAGKVTCTKREIASTEEQVCDDGYVMYGIDTLGKIKCRLESSGSSSSATVATNGTVFYESPEYDMGEMGNSATQGDLEVANPFPGKIPASVNWFLVNKTAEFGYEVGDEVIVNQNTAWGGYIATMVNKDVFRIVKRNQWYIGGKWPGQGGYNYPQSPKWKLRVRAIYNGDVCPASNPSCGSGGGGTTIASSTGLVTGGGFCKYDGAVGANGLQQSWGTAVSCVGPPSGGNRARLTCQPGNTPRPTGSRADTSWVGWSWICVKD